LATTTGTFNFDPALGTLSLLAFSRCQIQRTEITPQHMENAYLETNLMQSEWSADGILFFTVTLESVVLSPGQQQVPVPAQAIAVLDVYVSNGSQNRLLFPFSRTDFASLAEPQEEGSPTSFWLNRGLTQVLNLWPVPDNSQTYTLNYYIYTQPQDADLRQAFNAAVPYYWLDAHVAGLAHRLSRHHAPLLEERREKDAIKAYNTASKQVENVPMYITPGLSGYYRSEGGQ
jgi:hypothetical protein